jgi:hypothetical protein
MKRVYNPKKKKRERERKHDSRLRKMGERQKKL